MGRAYVALTDIEGTPCIRKKGASDVEINFYKFAASNLKRINTPKLLRVTQDDLFIEYIPNRMGLEQLQTNSNMFQQIAHLHLSQYSLTFEVKKHEWSDSATDIAFQALKLSKDEQYAVKHIQSKSSELFEYPGLISGDTNDGNWGTRSNGELVLFDWERFGKGSPAIDLAPLVKGLGSITDYEEVIEKYVPYNPSLSIQELKRHLIIAKCWIIVEVVNLLLSRGNPAASTYINWYRSNVPDWVVSVRKRL